MGTGNCRQLDSFDAPRNGAAKHPLLQIPLVPDILYAFLPELKQHPAKHQALLDQICRYLFWDVEVIAEALEEELSEAFFLTLYGLKHQLQHHDLCQVAVAITFRKEQYRDWIQSI